VILKYENLIRLTCSTVIHRLYMLEIIHLLFKLLHSVYDLQNKLA